MNKSGHIIELLGLPGSGKSYYAKELTQAGEGELIQISGRFERFWRALWYLVLHPRLAANLIHKTIEQQKYGDHSLKHKIFFLLFSAFAREQKAQQRAQSIVDEGLYQYAFSLYETQVTAENIERDLTWYGTDERRIIFMKASLENRTERMIERQRFPRGGKREDTTPEFSKVLTVTETCLEKLLEKRGAAVTVKENN